MKQIFFTLIILLWAATAWAAHPITSAQFTDAGYIHVVLDDGRQFDVPDNPSNTHRQQVAEWVAEGNSIAVYVAPPPPTADQRIDAAVSPTDRDRVFFEAIFELSNRLIALEGGTAVTRAQLRTWLRAKLP